MSFGEWMATRCAHLLGGGLWGHLNVRLQSKAALEIERERNRATAEDIRVLPHGAKLFETEVGGRTRVIVMPEPVAGPTYATGTGDAATVPDGARRAGSVGLCRRHGSRMKGAAPNSGPLFFLSADEGHCLRGAAALASHFTSSAGRP